MYRKDFVSIAAAAAGGFAGSWILARVSAPPEVRVNRRVARALRADPRLVRFAFGTAAGALYGAAAARWKPAGVLFGAGFWLGSDFAAPRLLGLGPSRGHAASLAGHLAYALTTEWTRRAGLAAFATESTPALPSPSARDWRATVPAA